MEDILSILKIEIKFILILCPSNTYKVGTIIIKNTPTELIFNDMLILIKRIKKPLLVLD